MCRTASASHAGPGTDFRSNTPPQNFGSGAVNSRGQRVVKRNSIPSFHPRRQLFPALPIQPGFHAVQCNIRPFNVFCFQYRALCATMPREVAECISPRLRIAKIPNPFVFTLLQSSRQQLLSFHTLYFFIFSPPFIFSSLRTDAWGVGGATRSTTAHGSSFRYSGLLTTHYSPTTSRVRQNPRAKSLIICTYKKRGGGIHLWLTYASCRKQIATVTRPGCGAPRLLLSTLNCRLSTSSAHHCTMYWSLVADPWSLLHAP